jgi:hypothetical protein
MDFELAKELKDAGFPQKSRGLHYTKTEGKELPYLAEGNLFLAKEGWQYSDTFVPSLEELIEACNTLSPGIELVCSDGNTVPWAHVRTIGSDEFFEGLSSNEAVARLWLALNQKQ